MDFDGVDIDFLTDDEILEIYNEVLESPQPQFLASREYCTCSSRGKELCAVYVDSWYSYYYTRRNADCK